jgi:hypothetical protein
MPLQCTCRAIAALAVTQQGRTAAPACPHLHAVHLHQQLRHHAVHHAARVPRSTPGRRQRVQLVKEHHTGPRAPGAGKGLAHLPLALAHVHVDELRALDGHEVAAALRGHGLGQKGLAAAGRAVQQHAGAPPQAASKQLPAGRRQQGRVSGLSSEGAKAVRPCDQVMPRHGQRMQHAGAVMLPCSEGRPVPCMLPPPPPPVPQWQLNGVQYGPLDVLQTAYVVPLHIGHLWRAYLCGCPGLDTRQGLLHVLPINLDSSGRAAAGPCSITTAAAAAAGPAPPLLLRQRLRGSARHSVRHHAAYVPRQQAGQLRRQLLRHLRLLARRQRRPQQLLHHSLVAGPLRGGHLGARGGGAVVRAGIKPVVLTVCCTNANCMNCAPSLVVLAWCGAGTGRSTARGAQVQQACACSCLRRHPPARHV